MLGKNKKLFNSIVCLLLAVTMLLGSVDYTFAGGPSGAGVAMVSIKSAGKHGSNNKILDTAKTTELTGRKLLGAGWVFGIARYNTSTEHGYEALSVEELTNAYKNGVLVYNANSYKSCADGCASLDAEISKYNLTIGNNVLIDNGLYFQDLEFYLKTYAYLPDNEGVANFDSKLFYSGFDIQDITDSGSLMSCVPFTKAVGGFGSSKSRLQVADAGNNGSYFSAVYPVNVSDQHAVAFNLGRIEYTHSENYPQLEVKCDCDNCSKCDEGCKCDVGTYKGENNAKIPAHVCDGCTFTWSDKEKATVKYATYNDTSVAGMFEKLVDWAGGNKLFTDGVANLPMDEINITNGVTSNHGGTLDNFLPASSSDAITANWTEVAQKLLGDASRVSKLYQSGQYILEDDFTSQKIPGGSELVYYKGNEDAYEKISDLVSSLTYIDTEGEVKTANGSTGLSTVISGAKDSAKTNLEKHSQASTIKSTYNIYGQSRGSGLYTGDDVDENELLYRYSYYVNYKIASETPPKGVACTISKDGTSTRDLQYNVYNTGGRVVVHRGVNSSFDNGMFTNAKEFAMDARKSEDAVLLNTWYTSGVGAETSTPSGITGFGSTVSDTKPKVKELVGNYDLKIKAVKNAENVASTIGRDISKFNELWGVIDGQPRNKNYDLNDAVYRGKLYDQLVELKGSSFKDSSGNEITRNGFVNNEVTGCKEEWIYVITAVPVILIENYLDGDDVDKILGTKYRGQTTIAVYPSCEFLRYDGTLDNDSRYNDSVGMRLLGTETYPVGGYLGCFAGISGVYSVGHKQYLTSDDGGATWDVVIGTGVTGEISNTSYTAKGTDDDNSAIDSSITYGGAKKIYKDENMDLIKDSDELVEPDFKGFAVYGANLDMSVRLTSNVTAYLDSSSFNASKTKKYKDVDFSNIGVRNYTLNEDEKAGSLKLDDNPYSVGLNYSYVTKGLRYWYSSQAINKDKKLFRTALKKNIATSEVTGIKANASTKKTTEYSNYDILNESSQFYIKSTNHKGHKFLIYKKNDKDGNYINNIIQYVNDRTKVKYEGTSIGGDISFGKLYSTRVIYDNKKYTKDSLAESLYAKIKSSDCKDWTTAGYKVYGSVLSSLGTNSITTFDGFDSRVNRFLDRNNYKQSGYNSLKTRGMVLAGKMLVNGLELTDPIDNNNNIGSNPGKFIISGTEEDGYSVRGDKQYATVSVQVYEKRKRNKSHLKVIDIELDKDGNFKSASDTGSFVHSRDSYYYDEESYIDWTKSGSGIPLITDRTDAEIATDKINEDACFINYMAVPNSSTYGYGSNGSKCFKASDINGNNFTIDKLKLALGASSSSCKKDKETGVNVGTTSKNDGYTVYVFRYYVKFQDGTTGETDGSITADSSLYLEDYELSHVYNNIYNRKDADINSIKDYYIRTSYTYKYKKIDDDKTKHTWVKGYDDKGRRELGNSVEYKKIARNYVRYIWQNKLTDTACKSIVGKYAVDGKDMDAIHNDSYCTVDGYDFSTIMGSDAYNWSYPQSSALAIPFTTTLTRDANKTLGYAVMLTRDMSEDKVTISGLSDYSKASILVDKDGNKVEAYTDAMRGAFIKYLQTSGVIKTGTEFLDVPQNDDAITASKVAQDKTIVNEGVSTNHRSTTLGTDSQSIRYGSDVTSLTATAGQDTQSDYKFYDVKDRISLTGGWQTRQDAFKKAIVYGDKADADKGEATEITESKFDSSKKYLGVGQYYILHHDIVDTYSDLRTLMAYKDRNGDRVHGFIANIDVYQYFYKYYVGARGIGENVDAVLGGTKKPTDVTNDYLFKAEDYLTKYTGTNSKDGKLPVNDGGLGAYTQVYRKAHDYLVQYYPEVKMSMQIPELEKVSVNLGVADETRTQVSNIYQDIIWTLGEYIRKTKLSSIYFVNIKSSGSRDTDNKLFSDNSVSNAKGSAFGNTIPSLYAGADVSLVVKPKFDIWTYGYSLDLINKDYDDNQNIVSLDGQKQGNKDLNYKYKDVVNDEVDIYESWDNTIDSRKQLLSDFTEFTKAVGMSLDADIILKSINSSSYDNGVIASDNAETYQNFSTSVGKLVSGQVNGGEPELVYSIEVVHGKIVDDESTVGGKSFNALLKQMAVDYYGINDDATSLAVNKVTSEQLKTMKSMFMDSAMAKTILDSIESDTDTDNTSNIVGHKILGVNNKASWNGINENHWYDERVKTFVVRRFSQKSTLDSVVLDDKLDYNMGVKSNGKNDNIQTSYGKKTYCWFMNLYMDYNLINKDKLINKSIATYFTQDGVYGTGADVWYSPTKDNNVSAYDAGTGLIRNLYLPGGDFNIVSDAVAN